MYRAVREVKAFGMIIQDLLESTMEELRRYASLQLLAFGGLIVLVTFGVLSSFTVQGWEGVAENLSENIAASALIAATTVAGFIVSAHRRALAKILAVQRLEYVAEPLAPGRLGQARSVLAQLRDRRRPGVVLIEASDTRARDDFLQELITVLTGQSVIAIVIPGRALLDTQASAAAHSRLRTMLAAAAVPEAPLTRVFESLARRRRAVVIISGLDESDYQATSRSSAQLVGARVAELQLARLPFIATVEPGSVPEQLLDTRLRLSPRTSAAPAPQAAGRTEHRLTAECPATAGEYGPLGKHLRPLLDTGFLGAFKAGHGWRHGSHACEALTEIAGRMLRFDSKWLDWADLVAALPADDADRFLTGVHGLEAAGLIERVVSSRRIQLRFPEPDLREVVIGCRAAASPLPLGYVADRGSAAFAGEAVHRLMIAGADAPEVWLELLAVARERGSLVAMADAADAVHGITGSRIVELDASWLGDTWERASDSERMAFVRRLPNALPDDITQFLWQQLVPPKSIQTRHTVRRVIGRALGVRGASSWTSLSSRWGILGQTATREGLAWHDRHTPNWKEGGTAIASLCWILPSVVLTCDSAAREDASTLLMELAAAVTPGSGPERSARPDLGIEISLAEGCKDLCHLVLTRGGPPPPVTWSLIELLAKSGRSWMTRLLAVQSAALAVAAGAGESASFLALCADLSGAGQHPLVRRYTALVADVLQDGEADFRSAVQTVVWADDTDALEAGGGDLTDTAIHILGLATLVLNLVEARTRSNGDFHDQQLARVTALVAPRLPGCLSSPVLAAASGRVECSCSLRLCGPTLNQEALRPISRTFAYRWLSPTVSRLTPGEKMPFAERWSRWAAATHFQRLTRRTARTSSGFSAGDGRHGGI
jgi:hypothetical protein